MMKWLVGLCLTLSLLGCRASTAPKPDVAESALPSSPAFDTSEIESPLLVEGDPEVKRVIEILSKNLIAGYRNSESLGPFGDTNDRFNHHVFWDADMWVFPVLAMIDPETSRRIPEFRLRTLQAAKENYSKWSDIGYPTAKETRHQPATELVALLADVEPAMFPWEGTQDGHEGSPSDTIYEHHVTGGVAWMLDKAIRLGLCDEKQGEDAIRACAAFFLHRLASNGDGTYGVLNVVSPSEWHTVDNDLYTNAIADWTIRRAIGASRWPEGRVRLPRREGTLGTFDGDDKSEYQQAAALLAVFPLGHASAKPESARMFELYRGKTAAFGPAMSHSVHSVIASRLGRKEDAYSDWVKSWQEYSRDPSREFREKPKHGESYFLTGAAASVGAVLFGFMNIQIFEDGIVPPEGDVTLRAQLPENIRSIQLRTKIQGRPVVLTAEKS